MDIRLLGNIPSISLPGQTVDPELLIHNASKPRQTHQTLSEIAHQIHHLIHNQQFEHFTIRHITQLIKTYAKRDFVYDQFFEAINQEVCQRAQSLTPFDPTAWAQLAHVYSSAPRQVARMLQFIADKLSRSLGDLQTLASSELATLARSYARVNVYHASLFRGISYAFRWRLSQHGWREITQILKAFAWLDIEDEALAKSLNGRMISVQDCAANDLSHFAQALSFWRFSRPETFSHIVTEIQRRSQTETGLKAFAPQSLRMLLASSYRMNKERTLYGPIAKEICDRSDSALSTFSATDISEIIRICTQLQKGKKTLIPKLFAESLKRKKNDFSPKALSYLSWAAVKNQSEHASKILSVFQTHSLSPEERVHLLWCHLISQTLTEKLLKEQLELITDTTLSLPACQQLLQVRLEAQLQSYTYKWSEELTLALAKALEQLKNQPKNLSSLELEVADILDLTNISYEPQKFIDCYPIDFQLSDRGKRILLQVHGPDHVPDDPAETLRDSQLQRLGQDVRILWWHKWQSLGFLERKQWLEKLFHPTLESKDIKEKKISLISDDFSLVSSSSPETTNIPIRPSHPRRIKQPQRARPTPKVKRRIRTSKHVITKSVPWDQFFQALDYQKHFLHYLSGPQLARLSQLSRTNLLMIRVLNVWHRFMKRDFHNLAQLYLHTRPNEPLDSALYGRLYQAAATVRLIKAPIPKGCYNLNISNGVLTITKNRDYILRYTDEPPVESALRLALKNRSTEAINRDNPLKQLIGNRAYGAISMPYVVEFNLNGRAVYLISQLSFKNSNLGLLEFLVQISPRSTHEFYLLSDAIPIDKKPNPFPVPAPIYGLDNACLDFAKSLTIASCDCAKKEELLPIVVEELFVKMSHPLILPLWKEIGKVTQHKQLWKQIDKILHDPSLNPPFIEAILKAQWETWHGLQLLLRELAEKVWRLKEVEDTVLQVSAAKMLKDLRQSPHLQEQLWDSFCNVYKRCESNRTDLYAKNVKRQLKHIDQNPNSKTCPIVIVTSLTKLYEFRDKIRFWNASSSVGN